MKFTAGLFSVGSFFATGWTSADQLSMREAVTSGPDQIREVAPATLPASVQPLISHPARVFLDKVDHAYSVGRPLRVRAQIRGELNAAGLSQAYSLDVTGYTDGSGLFRHEISANRTLVQTVDRLILFDHTSHTFGTRIQKPARYSSGQIPKVLQRILIDENPSLLACISDPPSRTLVGDADTIWLEGNELVISESDGPLRRIRLDDNGMIRSVVTDYTRYLEKRGVQKVLLARVMITYQTTEPWTVDPEQFRFEIPYTAMTFPLESELMRSRSDTPISRSENSINSRQIAPSSQPTAEPDE
ncbi:MAG: hypothetical protein KatS3mg104_1495 [Phycisphaerae bacterium]|nr:MAG: hypothetical protein KatS3mg104_1495 [Phycisphaerae bacterium]